MNILYIIAGLAALWVLWELVVTLRVLRFVHRRKNDLVRNRLSRVFGDEQ
jgi:uncharacterized membrane protein YuzA (DUF378 family)